MTKFKSKGIDISYHNGNLDISKFSDVDFVIVRAGFGKNNIDKKFKDYMKQLSKLKKKVGIYWFSYAYTEEMARKEANYCLNAIKNYDIDYPIFFDWEYDSYNYALKNGVKPTGSLICKMTDIFCKTIKSSGYETGFYFNKEYFDKYYREFALAKPYYLWYARYNKEMGKLPVNVDIWQYSSSGSIDGTNKKFDVNYSNINNYNNKKPSKTESKKKHYNYKQNVKDLQKLIGAKVDGIVGKETLSKLPTLRVSIQSKRIVQCMQKFLKHEHGYTLGGYGCDGHFGQSTEKAVKKFQKSKKLKVDGIVGYNTWKALTKRK